MSDSNVYVTWLACVFSNNPIATAEPAANCKRLNCCDNLLARKPYLQGRCRSYGRGSDTIQCCHGVDHCSLHTAKSGAAVRHVLSVSMKLLLVMMLGCGTSCLCMPSNTAGEQCASRSFQHL